MNKKQTNNIILTTVAALLLVGAAAGIMSSLNDVNSNIKPNISDDTDISSFQYTFEAEDLSYYNDGLSVIENGCVRSSHLQNLTFDKLSSGIYKMYFTFGFIWFTSIPSSTDVPTNTGEYLVSDLFEIQNLGSASLETFDDTVTLDGTSNVNFNCYVGTISFEGNLSFNIKVNKIYSYLYLDKIIFEKVTDNTKAKKYVENNYEIVSEWDYFD